MKTFALTIFLTITSVFANSDCLSGWQVKISVPTNTWKCTGDKHQFFKILNMEASGSTQDVAFNSNYQKCDSNFQNTFHDMTSISKNNPGNKFSTIQNACFDSSANTISIVALNANIVIKSPTGDVSEQINVGESATLCLNNNACESGLNCFDFTCTDKECLSHSHCGEGQYCVNNACSDEPCGWKYKMTSSHYLCGTSDIYEFRWGSQSIPLTGPNGAHLCNSGFTNEVIDWQNSICPPEDIMVKVYMNNVENDKPAIDLITPSGITLSFAKTVSYASFFNPPSLCSSTAACPTGQYCLAGDCGENECFSDSDCGSGRYCLNNLCSDEPCGWKIFTNVVSDSCSSTTTIQFFMGVTQ